MRIFFSRLARAARVQAARAVYESQQVRLSQSAVHSPDDGIVSARVSLLKGFDARGFVFYTNRGSRKAGDLLASPKAALLFGRRTHRSANDGSGYSTCRLL